MTDHDDFIIIRNKKNGSSILWVFFGIIGFLLIYFPLFGGNLRYTTGTFFSGIFTIAGTICCTLGILLLAWGFLTLICTRSFKALFIMLFGFFLLMLGSFFLEPGTLGMITDGKKVPKGYH
jgi:hypothetical protein